MDAYERPLSGLEYLEGVTCLLQRVRSAHPTAGVWEAADLQWWWRKPRSTDDSAHPFWFDDADHEVAAAVVTEWSGRFGLDLIVVPSLGAGIVREVWHSGLASLRAVGASTVEVMVDDDDGVMVSLLDDSGFVALPEKGASAWMPAEARPEPSPLTVGYSLRSRLEMGNSPHHMVARSGAQVEERLRQTSLYRPDLDLCVVDREGDVAAYGLFWHDPTTRVGFVEPMRTEETHQRKGLARHILTSGIERLVRAGATRIKVNYEQGNEASSSLYLDIGFVPSMTTSVYVRGA